MRKVLIANRGEIAVRVIRACHDLGLTAVAVYSEVDADALHVRMADEAYLLGPTPPAESYLNVEALLRAAALAHVDAIHPGYGFLAENAHFARAVLDAGIRWVGPPPEVIAVLGDKVQARKLAAAAGSAVVPGTLAPLSDAAEAAAFAAEHGFPIAAKAVFGGGGRGMRIARNDEQLTEALASAERESGAAFGRSEVYLERYLDAPRHIEAQILADGRGDVVFLGERDCSLQRRHQKLLEESPAPGITPEQRKALGETACAIARTAGYESAGTVEFLYERETGSFYFLEVNTRLQVEHPVTEEVTGLDIVTAQLLIAGGEALPDGFAEPVFHGHAIECRINSEDPGRNFLPRPGTITKWIEPEGPGVRVDSGVCSGSVVPHAYDSLLAKLVVHGADREEARHRAIRALREFEVEGIPTTIPFHSLALEHPLFIAGEVSTTAVGTGIDLSSLPKYSPPRPS
ncbi:MAG: acetyl-CoA carboxylase biotin carboxylase subunit [Actinomycetota bacterium]